MFVYFSILLNLGICVNSNLGSLAFIIIAAVLTSSRCFCQISGTFPLSNKIFSAFKKFLFMKFDISAAAAEQTYTDKWTQKIVSNHFKLPLAPKKSTCFSRF